MMRLPIGRQPKEGDAVRFCTTQSISNDLSLHGIDGVYRDGRFWSSDRADHWVPREVTRWEHAVTARSGLPPPVDVAAARLLLKSIARDWDCMTPEARSVFGRELGALATNVLPVQRSAVLRADFEAWHLRRMNDADYIAATDKARAWLAVSELAGGLQA